MIIELSHPTDPRYLMVNDPPPQVTIEDLGNWTYGKAMLFAPGPVDMKYESPSMGLWVRPVASP